MPSLQPALIRTRRTKRPSSNQIRQDSLLAATLTLLHNAHRPSNNKERRSQRRISRTRLQQVMTSLPLPRSQSTKIDTASSKKNLAKMTKKTMEHRTTLQKLSQSQLRVLLLCLLNVKWKRYWRPSPRLKKAHQKSRPPLRSSRCSECWTSSALSKAKLRRKTQSSVRLHTPTHLTTLT